MESLILNKILAMGKSCHLNDRFFTHEVFTDFGFLLKDEGADFEFISATQIDYTHHYMEKILYRWNHNLLINIKGSSDVQSSSATEDTG